MAAATIPIIANKANASGHNPCDAAPFADSATAPSFATAFSFLPRVILALRFIKIA